MLVPNAVVFVPGYIPVSYTHLDVYKRQHIDDATFDLFSLARIEDFGPLLQTHQDLHGLAVTIPYKTAVIPYLQVLNEEAAKIGAINCIQFTAQGLKGFNTDISVSYTHLDVYKRQIYRQPDEPAMANRDGAIGEGS